MKSVKKIDYKQDCENIMFPDRPLTEELNEIPVMRKYDFWVVSVIKYSKFHNKCSSGCRYK